jgi:hypothetical protein
MLTNKPMAGWRIVAGFWGASALFGMPIKEIWGDGAAAIFALVFLITLSTYLYSKRFAAFVNGLLARANLI